ncbi:hypothetical protein LguiA_007402 [Lonicera macranthoides]
MGKPKRVVLDVGCCVARFYNDVITMSFARKDGHKARIQFALEMIIPATLCHQYTGMLMSFLEFRQFGDSSRIFFYNNFSPVLHEAFSALKGPNTAFTLSQSQLSVLAFSHLYYFSAHVGPFLKYIRLDSVGGICMPV